jgi:hypothetical protein
LYYNGKFQTNNYPNVTSYTWNGLSGDYTYNAGSSGLNLSGSQVTSGTRYKWIVFKLYKKSGSTTIYTFNGAEYTIKTNQDTVRYLSIKDVLSSVSGLFNSTSVTNLFDENSQNAIGFCRVTRTYPLSGNTVTYVGNFKQLFNPTGGIWSDDGSQATGYTNSLSNSYGAKVASNTGDFGIYVNPGAYNDDLCLFVGLQI